MIDPRIPTLGSRASLPIRPSANGASAPGQKKGEVRHIPANDLRVDRAALIQFAVVQLISLILYLVIGPSTNDEDWGVVNLICPLMNCLAGLWTGYKIVVSNPRTIWTPMPWFALNAAIYTGLGPLVYPLGNAEIHGELFTDWPMDPFELWRTNLLNTVCLLTIYTVFLAADRFLDTARRIDQITPPTEAGRDASARTALFVFLGIGLPLRYLLVLPSTFGQLGFVLPGSLFILGFLDKLAVFVLAYLERKQGGHWKPAFWLLFVSEAISSLITFSKLEVIQLFIMAFLGRYFARKKIKELVIGGIVCIGIYLWLTPFVSWSRRQLYHETGDINLGSFELRLSTAFRGIELWSQGALDVEQAKQGWWARICFNGPQSAAMRLYDAGAAGDSFSYAYYGWIPRYLWPDKPTMNLGEEFAELIFGVTGNNVGPGIFGEAYWNGGWLLAVLTAAYMGVVFAWLSRSALRIMARSEWVLLPCAFLGIAMGMRLEEWFAPTFVVGLLMYLAFYLIIRFVLRIGQNPD